MPSVPVGADGGRGQHGHQGHAAPSGEIIGEKFGWRLRQTSVECGSEARAARRGFGQLGGGCQVIYFMFHFNYVLHSPPFLSLLQSPQSPRRTLLDVHSSHMHWMPLSERCW